MARDYGALAISETGNRDRLVDELRATVEALRINFPGYTSEVRYTNRVFSLSRLFNADMLFAQAVPSSNKPAKTQLLYATATGDRGNFEFFPLNAVRWLTLPREIAALVTRSGREGLTAELFHFGPQPRPMQAEFYLLASGAYSLTLTGRSGRSAGAPQSFQVTGARTRVSFEIPPAEPVTLRVLPSPPP